MTANSTCLPPRGGENHIGNLLPSCASCNSDKRDLLLDEWAIEHYQPRCVPCHKTYDLAVA